jgi:hypothetical protein
LHRIALDHLNDEQGHRVARLYRIFVYDAVSVGLLCRKKEKPRGSASSESVRANVLPGADLLEIIVFVSDTVNVELSIATLQHEDAATTTENSARAIVWLYIKARPDLRVLLT